MYISFRNNKEDYRKIYYYWYRHMRSTILLHIVTMIAFAQLINAALPIFIHFPRHQKILLQLNELSIKFWGEIILLVFFFLFYIFYLKKVSFACYIKKAQRESFQFNIILNGIEFTEEKFIIHTEYDGETALLKMLYPAYTFHFSKHGLIIIFQHTLLKSTFLLLPKHFFAPEEYHCLETWYQNSISVQGF